MKQELRIKNQKSKINTIIHDSLFMIRKAKGFTLIELLIVIVIIGILSAILMANFVGVRQRARDGQRKSDLRQIQTALELYRTDNGSYPASPSNLTTDLENCGTADKYFGAPGGATCSTTYMQKVPKDPLSSSALVLPYFYVVGTPPTTYKLATCLENANDSQGIADALCDYRAGKIYILTNP